jgi:hypothetical protein
MIIKANGQQSQNVRVIEVSHEFGFFQEINLLLFCRFPSKRLLIMEQDITRVSVIVVHGCFGQ